MARLCRSVAACFGSTWRWGRIEIRLDPGDEIGACIRAVVQTKAGSLWASDRPACVLSLGPLRRRVSGGGGGGPAGADSGHCGGPRPDRAVGPRTCAALSRHMLSDPGRTRPDAIARTAERGGPG